MKEKEAEEPRNLGDVEPPDVVGVAGPDAAKLAFEYIVKEPGYCSGKAASGAPRVRVDNVVYLHKQGKTADEIRVEHTDLTHAQVYAALAYYHDHQDEIEAELVDQLVRAADLSHQRIGDVFHADAAHHALDQARFRAHSWGLGKEGLESELGVDGVRRLAGGADKAFARRWR